MTLAAFMSDAHEIGRVASRIAPRGGRSGPPESRPHILDGSPRTAGPQPRDVLRLALQGLRSGEWVMEPTARGSRGDRTRPPRALCRVLTEFYEAH